MLRILLVEPPNSAGKTPENIKTSDAAQGEKALLTNQYSMAYQKASIELTFSQ
jgi:hypothetical protein